MQKFDKIQKCLPGFGSATKALDGEWQNVINFIECQTFFSDVNKSKHGFLSRVLNQSTMFVKLVNVNQKSPISVSNKIPDKLYRLIFIDFDWILS